MTQWRMVVSILVGGILLTLPTTAAARCSGSGPTFRCDPIVSESLRRQYEEGKQRLQCVTPPTSRRYKSAGHTYTSPHTGASIHRYKLKSGGRTYTGKIETFLGGSYRHKGSWR